MYETLAWNWTVGDTLELPAERSNWRIVKILDLDESDDSSGEYQAALMVEPAQETILYDVSPRCVCGSETSERMRWHELDERDARCAALPQPRL
jgi:hypothetical protein